MRPSREKKRIVRGGGGEKGGNEEKKRGKSMAHSRWVGTHQVGKGGGEERSKEKMNLTPKGRNPEGGGNSWAARSENLSSQATRWGGAHRTLGC